MELRLGICVAALAGKDAITEDVMDDEALIDFTDVRG